MNNTMTAVVASMKRRDSVLNRKVMDLVMRELLLLQVGNTVEKPIVKIHQTHPELSPEIICAALEELDRIGCIDQYCGGDPSRTEPVPKAFIRPTAHAFIQECKDIRKEKFYDRLWVFAIGFFAGLLATLLTMYIKWLITGTL